MPGFHLQSTPHFYKWNILLLQEKHQGLSSTCKSNNQFYFIVLTPYFHRQGISLKINVLYKQNSFQCRKGSSVQWVCFWFFAQEAPLTFQECWPHLSECLWECWSSRVPRLAFLHLVTLAGHTHLLDSREKQNRNLSMWLIGNTSAWESRSLVLEF